MTQRRLKMTGCARFFIALLIIIPIAYFSAKLIRGEGIPAVDQFLERIISSDEKSVPTTSTPDDTQEIKALEREVKALKAVNKSLNEQLDACRAEKKK